MRARVAWRIETLEFDAAADADDVALAHRPVERAQLRPCACMRQHPRAGGRAQPVVAADMVAVLVGVEDVGDGPAVAQSGGVYRLPVEGVDRHGLAGLPAGDEIVEVAPGVPRPDALDDHHGSCSGLSPQGSSGSGAAASDPAVLPTRTPRRRSASRSMYSTWPFTLRRSSAAQRSSSRQSAGSIRIRNDLRSATARQP